MGVGAVDDGPLGAAAAGACGLAEHVVGELVGPQVILLPQRLEVAGEPLVEPQVRPVAAGQEVAPPLVGELVGDQAVGVVVDKGAGVVQDAVAQRGRRGVLHPAPEALAADLGVAVPGVLNADRVTEEIEHPRGVAERAGDPFLKTRVDPVLHRLAPPGLLFDMELAHDQRDQVGDMRLVLEPVVGDGARRLILRPGNQPAV